MLRSQKMLDGQSINANQITAALGGGALGALAGAAGLSGLSNMIPSGGFHIQLWQLMKLDCHMLEGMISTDPAVTGKHSAPSKHLDFDIENPQVGARQN